MFARIEVGMKPEFKDPAALSLLRKIEIASPALRKKIRWARLLDVYWLDLPFAREDLISAIGEIFWDRVLQWMFTGNLIPAAGGKTGNVFDLMELAPNRPGKFFALERRYRGGVTDNIGRTALEAFEIVLGEKIPVGQASSGSMLLLEGSELTDADLGQIARDVYCNELIESWTILPESELQKTDRFHQERVKRDLPKLNIKSSDRVESISLEGLTDEALLALNKKKLWALSLAELKAVRDHFKAPLTDVEIEVIAQTWSEHCKHKIFGAKFTYVDASPDALEDNPNSTEVSKIPAQIDSLFKTTISGTTAEIPKPWLLSVFDDNAGIIAFDEEDAFCIKVETHNSPSALDPYGGALTGIVGVNRDILGCGLGAKPIFNTNVFCVAPPSYAKSLPDRILHPRRILEGVRRGVEHGGNKSGIPTINGALVFDDRFLGKPLVYCGTGGFMPRTSAGRPCELKEIKVGDRICMVGGRIGKDGIHGATFSSLALDEDSPSTAVQLGDPITQKRAADFLLEARELGLYRAITDNGAGGLSSSVGELARLSGGARMDVSLAKTKYPGLKPYELVVSESQERMTMAVPPEQLHEFKNLASRRGVEVSDLGEFNDSGKFEIFYGEKKVGSLDLEFLHKGAPQLELKATWRGRPKFAMAASGITRNFESGAAVSLLELLGSPNIASKEWLIRQYDHEVQGMSVIKPLHTHQAGTAQAMSGPNDAGVVKPKPGSDSGIAVGCGLNPKLSDIDPYLMAQASVDEAVRNVLCVGADYGRKDSILALVDNFCWPDPVSDEGKASALVRACFGLRDACLALKAPLVSGKDSMKNDFRGKQDGQPVTISVPPTLLMTAVAKVSDIRHCRTADFKAAGDFIYLLGPGNFGLLGSEFQVIYPELPGSPRVGEPTWEEAKLVYGWIGGGMGKEQAKLHSLHDVSEGGLLVAIAEGLLARNLGAKIYLKDAVDAWEFSFGEGFHSFVTSVSEADSDVLETEWKRYGVPYLRIGSVTGVDKLEVFMNHEHASKGFSIETKKLRSAWQKEGYWE